MMSALIRHEVVCLGDAETTKENYDNMKVSCGDLFFIVYGRSCGSRLIGVSRNAANDGFEQSWGPTMISEHLDTSGTTGEKARDELSFRCKTDHAPFFTQVAVGSIPLTPAP